MYFDREDPRIFVYVSERHKWLGVSLNCGRWQGRLIALPTVFLRLLMWFTAVLALPAVSQFGMLYLTLAVWLVNAGVLALFYRAAARDDRRWKTVRPPAEESPSITDAAARNLNGI